MRRSILKHVGQLAAVSLLGAGVSLLISPSDTGAGNRQVRRAPRLAPLSAKALRARNVLLVITESVRFDSACVEYRPDCRLTPFTNRLAETRLPLREVRANSSSTAISVGVLWSGLLPTETTDIIRAAPMLFDYARAAGYDTGYWTSQSTMFTDSDAFFAALPLSRRCLGKDLGPIVDDGGADDTLLTDRVRSEIGKLREPWLAVVQYANTHYPYRVRGEQPFQPATESKATERTGHFKNHYQNAVYEQDRTIADLLSVVKASTAGARTVVIYTSDHGEAFREHGQLGHTGSVFDEEIHVPAWIDAPAEALMDGERDALAAAKDALVWHVDFAPTILDLLGVWDAPGLASHRKRMVGTSLLRSDRTKAILPLTNCAEIWGCDFRNWGVMKGTLKLESRQFDADWHCWNLAIDPHEQHDLGTETCADLKSSALRFFGRLPREGPEMRGFGGK